MCFSAPVSFAASAGLAGVGGAAYKKAKKKYQYIAVIPLMFGIQQFFEGMQWLSPSTNYLYAYGFLFFAFLVWPTYIPLAILKMERLKSRKILLRRILWAGFFASSFLLTMLLLEPLSVTVADNRIIYTVNINEYLIQIGIVFYVSVIVGSMFVSSDRWVQIFGILLLASAAISWIFFNMAFISVWCFMAAILSFLIYYFIYKRS